MSFPSEVSFALFNLGGGEIILILAVLFILAVVALGFLGLIYLIVRAVVNRPSPAPPSPLPPQVVSQNQQQRDREHLQLLSIFHFVFAGLALVGIGFLGVHYTTMHTVFSNPEVWKSQPAGPPPQVFLNAFTWFYLFMGILFLAALVLNVLSGVFLRQRTNWVFSLVVAAVNCLQIPFGTALGVFTLIVLNRESVRQLYSGQTQTYSTA